MANLYAHGRTDLEPVVDFLFANIKIYEIMDYVGRSEFINEIDVREFVAEKDKDDVLGCFTRDELLEYLGIEDSNA